jgi:hypothetical protein
MMGAPVNTAKQSKTTFSPSSFSSNSIGFLTQALAH